MYRSTSPPATRTRTPDLQPRPQRNRECPRLEIKYTEKNELSILTESCKNREFVSQSNGEPCHYHFALVRHVFTSREALRPSIR